MGFFGTVTQVLRLAEPQWLVELLLAGVFPLLFQVGDICFHSALGTQAFRSGMIASAVFTALSALFNLYIMRRGTLLVGEEGSSVRAGLDYAAEAGPDVRPLRSAASLAHRRGHWPGDCRRCGFVLAYAGKNIYTASAFRFA